MVIALDHTNAVFYDEATRSYVAYINERTLEDLRSLAFALDVEEKRRSPAYAELIEFTYPVPEKPKYREQYWLRPKQIVYPSRKVLYIKSKQKRKRRLQNGQGRYLN